MPDALLGISDCVEAVMVECEPEPASTDIPTVLPEQPDSTPVSESLDATIEQTGSGPPPEVKCVANTTITVTFKSEVASIPSAATYTLSPTQHPATRFLTFVVNSSPSPVDQSGVTNIGVFDDAQISARPLRGAHVDSPRHV